MLFRPPHGQVTPGLARELGKKYRLIMWSALTRDYDMKISPEECLRIATKSLSPGSIIVFHDSLKAWKNLQVALPLFLEHCTNQGYTFSAM
jgi:peptidoglycan-N-acetylglucosamine deacetylase